MEWVLVVSASKLLLVLSAALVLLVTVEPIVEPMNKLTSALSITPIFTRDELPVEEVAATQDESSRGLPALPS